MLDDNRTLCLSSGEMMPLREGVSLLLETDSIAHASPATVSRCGVVYMSAPLDLWRSVLDCWLERVSDGGGFKGRGGGGTGGWINGEHTRHRGKDIGEGVGGSVMEMKGMEECMTEEFTWQTSEL